MSKMNRIAVLVVCIAFMILLSSDKGYAKIEEQDGHKALRVSQSVLEGFKEIKGIIGSTERLDGLKGTFYSPGIGCGTVGASGKEILSNRSIALNADYMSEHGLEYGDIVKMIVVGGNGNPEEHFNRYYGIDDCGCDYGVVDIVLSREDARATGLMTHGVLYCSLVKSNDKMLNEYLLRQWKEQ